MPLGVLEPPHHVEDVRGGDELGGQNALQPHGVDDARIVEPVALGDDLGKAHLPGIEGDDDVVLVLVGKGHKGIK